MICKLQLQQMKKIDIAKADPNTLADVNQIQIDSSLPQEQKMERYFEQVGNPYCFRCGDTPVKIRFVSEDKTLNQSLCNYFLSLK